LFSTVELHFPLKACEYIRHLKSMIKEQQNFNTNDELENEVRRLSEENELLRIENNKLKRKYHIEGLNDDEEDEDFLLKRPKSENDDFKLDMPEFCDSLPGDDITT
jgi:regulator of replication initiation timing